MEDGDLHLVLALGTRKTTLIAEIPRADCAFGALASLHASFTGARHAVERALGPAPAGYAEFIRPSSVRVTGAAFFDFRDYQRGLAPNAIELHPVVEIRFR